MTASDVNNCITHEIGHVNVFLDINFHCAMITYSENVYPYWVEAKLNCCPFSHGAVTSQFATCELRFETQFAHQNKHHTGVSDVVGLIHLWQWQSFLKSGAAAIWDLAVAMLAKFLWNGSLFAFKKSVSIVFQTQSWNVSFTDNILTVTSSAWNQFAWCSWSN